MLNSHLIGFLALAKERVRLLPFGWHPGTQLLGAHLNSYTRRRFMGFVVFVALQHYTLIRGCLSYALKTMSYQIRGIYCFLLPLYSSMP
ncbi:MAG: hypothetical protein KZQ62_04730 [Candidatus Thiodiazotropha sp. (ex Lucinoma aequizonata)]|nr:hypothetical protein [Candidatus Thiodiazotropha sp. (ex Lucinoma aequizonata)]